MGLSPGLRRTARFTPATGHGFHGSRQGLLSAGIGLLSAGIGLGEPYQAASQRPTPALAGSTDHLPDPQTPPPTPGVCDPPQLQSCDELEAQSGRRGWGGSLTGAGAKTAKTDHTPFHTLPRGHGDWGAALRVYGRGVVVLASRASTPVAFIHIDLAPEGYFLPCIYIPSSSPHFKPLLHSPTIKSHPTRDILTQLTPIDETTSAPLPSTRLPKLGKPNRAKNTSNHYTLRPQQCARSTSTSTPTALSALATPSTAERVGATSPAT